MFEHLFGRCLTFEPKSEADWMFEQILAGILKFEHFLSRRMVSSNKIQHQIATPRRGAGGVRVGLAGCGPPQALELGASEPRRQGAAGPGVPAASRQQPGPSQETPVTSPRTAWQAASSSQQPDTVGRLVSGLCACNKRRGLSQRVDARARPGNAVLGRALGSSLQAWAQSAETLHRWSP